MLEIEHFFAPVSGFAYLGHEALLQLARQRGARVRQRPVDIVQVFQAAGATPPAKQSDARRAWRSLDMRRWATRRGLALNDNPRFWPTDGAPAARAIVALGEIGGPVDEFTGAVLAAVWARDLDIADAGVLRALLRECGADADKVIDFAASDEIASIYAENTREAIAAGAVGSPVYRVNGEIFFGQDRLDFVQDALGAIA